MHTFAGSTLNTCSPIKLHTTTLQLLRKHTRIQTTHAHTSHCLHGLHTHHHTLQLLRKYTRIQTTHAHTSHCLRGLHKSVPVPSPHPRGTHKPGCPQLSALARPSCLTLAGCAHTCVCTRLCKHLLDRPRAPHTALLATSHVHTTLTTTRSICASKHTSLRNDVLCRALLSCACSSCMLLGSSVLHIACT